ncbi:type II secretion system protein GspG [Kiritimatiellaeota bacterium B1221]|nr:type II secretion system protein GspG [Kiritimatiellaeota bacterium B1221]
MTKSSKRSKEAFTLIEVMLVVMILGVLAAVAISNLDIGKKSDDTRRTATKVLMGQLSGAIDSYYLDVGKMPTSLEGLVSDPGVRNWNGPYLKKMKPDAWGDPFTYSASGRKYEIRSNAGGTEEGPISSDDL